MTAARFGTFDHVSLLIDACRQWTQQSAGFGENASDHAARPKVRLWDVQDVNGEAPLHAAAMRNEASIVRLLLGCGAKTNLKTETRETALDLARLLECKDAARALTAANAEYTPQRMEEGKERKQQGRGRK